MSLLVEFSRHIAALTGMTVGQDLWAGYIEVYAPSRAAVVMAVGGDGSRPILAGNIGEFPFQIVARDAHPHDAHDLAMLIHGALADLPGADLTEWFVHTCRVVTEPQELGYDEKQRFEWAAQYVLRAHEKAAAPWLTPGTP